jgi:hypothetical protein
MRNLILIVSTIIIASCGKSNLPKKTYRSLGYIYNIEDSTPFSNTEFKKYDDGLVQNIGDEKTLLFQTDSDGYFNITTDFMGHICWPSYYRGSGYNGPPTFTSIDDSIDRVLNQPVSIYKVYTKRHY